MNAPRSFPLWTFPLAALMAAAFWIESRVWALYQSTGCPEALGWEASLHARDGLRLFQNLRTLSPISFLLNALSMTYWPPMPALMQVPFYVFGATNDSAALASVASWFGLFAVGCVALLHPRGLGGSLLGALAFAALVLTSPLLLVYSVYAMYEAPGAFWSVVTAVAWWKSLEGDERATRAAALGTLALLLSKWSFGIPALVAGVAIEAIASPPAWRAAVRRWALDTLDPRVLRVLSAGAWLALLLAAFIGLTGGGVYSLRGTPLSLTRPDNPLWAALVLFALKAFKLWRGSEGLRELCPERHRVFLRWLVVPFAAWMAIPVPNRLSGLLYHFSHGGDFPGGGRFAWENLQFYFADFVPWYSGSSFFLGLLLIGAALAFWRIRRLPADKRLGPCFAIGFAAFAFASATLGTGVKDSRLVLTYLAPLFLFSAWGWSAVPRKPASVGIGLLLSAAWLWSKTLPAQVRGPGDLARLCLSRELPAEWRREVFDRGTGDRPWILLGIEADSPLAPMAELELIRRFPKLSKFPYQSPTDLGYRTSAVAFVEGALQAKSSWWALCLKPRAGLLSEDAEQACAKLETAKAVRRVPVALPASGYDGVLYRLGDTLGAVD